MKTFNEVVREVGDNLEYWSEYVSRRCELEKDDVFQELLIAIWNDYCKRNKITKYFMQKRIQFAAYRTLLNYFSSNEANLSKVRIDESFDFEDVKLSLRIKRLEESEIILELKFKLSEKSRITQMVFEYLLSGMSTRKIARELKTSHSNVYKKKKEIKSILEGII